jgi:hypothetical protein
MFMSDRKKSNPGCLVLSFFGDKGLADNLAYVPAYPSEMSYFRPFRYRKGWIDDALWAELSQPEARTRLVDQSVILAIRFCSEGYQPLVLPFRMAKITHIDFIADNVSVYFQLGAFFVHDSSLPLAKQCLRFNSDADGVPIDRLFFRCNPLSVPPVLGNGKDEDEAWITWITAISTDDSLPFNDQARRYVFIRISRLREKKTAPIRQIYSSWSKGPIHGFQVQEGKTYEFVYLHRVPFLLGKSQPVPRFNVTLEPHTSNWEFPSKDEEVSANYQLHAMTMAALTPSASWEDVVLQSDRDEIETPSAGKLYTLPFHFSVKIRKSHWHRLWTRYIWLVLLAVVVIAKDAVLSSLKGENYTLDLIVGLFTFVILILGYVISQKGLLK